MQPEASKAAIAAIAALQKRIRELEDENCLLEDEYNSLKSQIENRDDAFVVRETALDDAKARAKMMLSETQSSMQQLGDSRSENIRLKNQIDEIEHLIQEQTQKNKKYRIKQRRLLVPLSRLLEKLSEYEILLADILSPPPVSVRLSEEKMALISSAETDADVLPPPLSDILRALQNLPKNFKKQNIEMKREIVKTLYHAKTATSEIYSKISHIERKKFSSSSPKKFEAQICNLSINLLILSNEMKRFIFY